MYIQVKSYLPDRHPIFNDQMYCITLEFITEITVSLPLYH
jgi:hypothetical protein